MKRLNCHPGLNLIVLISLFVVSPSIQAKDQQVLAFPEAEGFGAHSKGGRGGEVLFVKNLKDSGPGSLREAVTHKGPRTILFLVSGTIDLESSLVISEPFVTIAGQSAPGDGICLKNYGLSIKTGDVIVRYLRVRPGDEPGPAYKAKGKGFSPDAISISSGSRDVMIDHCSAGWAIDECLSVSGKGITNVTVQWCLISESLNDSFHPKGQHGYGSLLRTNGNITFHHNIYAHHKSRSPRPGTYGEGSILLDFRNNVIYDSVGYSAADPVRMNYIGNYIRNSRGYAFQVGGDETLLYVEGNYDEALKEKNKDNWNLIRKLKPVNKKEEPFEVAPVKTDSAEVALDRDLAECGATLPKRDSVDARVIRQIRTGEGTLINSQTDVGGWPVLKRGLLAKDSDRDGMPDYWEKKYSFDPQKATHNDDPDNDGYTNLEEFLNRTNPLEKN